MKQCAVVMNGKDIIKVSNLPRKYNKIINNPLMKILEECDKSSLEERFLYHKDKYKLIEEIDEPKNNFFYYKDVNNNTRILSIYKLDNYTEITKEEYFK